MARGERTAEPAVVEAQRLLGREPKRRYADDVEVVVQEGEMLRPCIAMVQPQGTVNTGLLSVVLSVNHGLVQLYHRHRSGDQIGALRACIHAP